MSVISFDTLFNHACPKFDICVAYVGGLNDAMTHKKNEWLCVFSVFGRMCHPCYTATESHICSGLAV